MAGLAGAAAPVVDPAEDGEMASPEEQQLYEEIVSRAMLLIFDEKTRAVRASVIEAMKGDENPKEALGQIAATIFHRVEQAAAEKGVEIPGDVREAAGAEVFEVLAQVATNEGVYDFMSDDEAFEGAFYIAADALRGMSPPDPEAAAAEFEEIAAMDRDGRLAAIMGGEQ